MKAIQLDPTIPRYVFGKVFGTIYEPLLWSGLSCVTYRDTPEPRLPNPEWVKIKTRYGGICGSDNSLLHLKTSLAASGTGSFPFTIGHENCGTIVEVGSAARGFAVGERVVAEPSLWCKPRGFKDLCPACARGEFQLCERVTEGAISAGLEIGACRDTGGTWSPYFVAHESQLVRVPDGVTDVNASLLEPFSASVHAVLANMPRDEDTVLVIGAGVIGLGVIAALRAAECRARIIVIARHPRQQELARRFGADVVIASTRGNALYTEFAHATGAKVLKAIMGNPMLLGGADMVYECVGSGEAIDHALRLARGRGRVVIAGLAAFPKGVDWTPVWMHELQINGTLAAGEDGFKGKRHRTFELALDWMARGKVDLKPMLTHKFPLHEYARAFQTVNQRGRAGAIKVAFEFP